MAGVVCAGTMLLLSSLLLACSSPNYPCGDCGSRQMRTRTGLSRTCFSARASCTRLGRSGARCVTTCWTLAPHIGLGGGADVTVVPSNATEIVKHRDRQAMDRRTRSAGAPLGSGDGGRLSPADLGQRNGRRAHRVVHRPPWRTVRRSRRVKRITNAAPPVHSCSRSEFLLPITSRDSSALRTLACTPSRQRRANS